MPIEIRDVELRYGKKTILNQVTANIPPGITGLIGMNGAGKTTLMHAIAGLKKPTTGSITVDGIPVTDRGAARKAPVAFMTQHMNFPHHMTSIEALTYYQWCRGHSWTQSTTDVTTALAKVGLADKADSKIKHLSGGMKRRLALAATLAANCNTVLLDEPSTGLDPAQRETMVHYLAQLNGTVLLSSHVLEDLHELANHILVVHNAGIAFSGSKEEFLANTTANGSKSAMWQAFQRCTGVEHA